MDSNSREKLYELSFKILEENVIHRVTVETIRNLPVPAWFNTKYGINVTLNAEFQKLMGYSAKEIEDSNWSIAIHPDDHIKSLNMWSELNSHPQSVVSEIRFLPKDECVYKTMLCKTVPFYIKDVHYGFYGVCIPYEVNLLIPEGLK